LGQIQSNDLTNILIVVVRYFGGTLLGVSGLINAYKKSAADVIKVSSIIEKQILFLKKKCNVVSVQDFFERKFIKNKINVAITFDDGYLNNYTNAFPILEKYKVPSTIYCTGLNKIGENILWADFVNIASTLTDKEIEIEGEIFVKNKSVYTSTSTGKNIYETVKNIKPDYSFKQSIYDSLSFVKFKNDLKYDEYWKLMSDEQIREISNSNYVTIGSHGFYHNNLGNISTENAKKEIEDSFYGVQFLKNSPPQVRYMLREIKFVVNNSSQKFELFDSFNLVT
jgi:peptidoglycan/xylan/chitin deacetylase (PgdA/CDA1 family)